MWFQEHYEYERPWPVDKTQLPVAEIIRNWWNNTGIQLNVRKSAKSPFPPGRISYAHINQVIACSKQNMTEFCASSHWKCYAGFNKTPKPSPTASEGLLIGCLGLLYLAFDKNEAAVWGNRWMLKSSEMKLKSGGSSLVTRKSSSPAPVELGQVEWETGTE